MVTTTDDLPAEVKEEPADDALDAKAEAKAEAKAAKAEAEAEAAAEAARSAPTPTPDERKAHENKMMIMQNLLAKQPKVRVRIRKEIGPQSVIINGARFNIPAGIPVEVPEQVAELLRDAEII